MRKTYKIVLEALPVLFMILLIPVIKNDYLLTSTYLVIIAAVLLVKRKKDNLIIFIFGLVVMTIFEFIFISTGVETFNRNTLFGIMPLWLPFLWGYGFVAIKAGVEELGK